MSKKYDKYTVLDLGAWRIGVDYKKADEMSDETVITGFKEDVIVSRHTFRKNGDFPAIFTEIIDAGGAILWHKATYSADTGFITYPVLVPIISGEKFEFPKPQGENAMTEENRIQQIFVVSMNWVPPIGLKELNQAVVDGAVILHELTTQIDTYMVYTVLVPASKING